MIEYYRGFAVKRSGGGEFFATRMFSRGGSITTRNHESLDALKSDIDEYWRWELSKNNEKEMEE